MADFIRITPTADTKATLERLARIDITPEIRREINAATQSVVSEIRNEIHAMPTKTSHKSKGRNRQGLRAALARQVKKHVHLSKRRTQVMIEVQHDGGLANLARAVEGEIPWHHPVFGQPDTDVKQAPKPFFWHVIARATAALDARIRAAVDAAIARTH